MSSQMPWNITASLQGSHFGSASSIPRPFDSAGSSAHLQVSALSRFGSRFPSASPLAGRGGFIDTASYERMSSLSIAEGDFFDGDPFINLDLDDEVLHGQDNDPMFGHRQDPTRDENVGKHYSSQTHKTPASLSVEDRNFFTFVDLHIKSVQPMAALAFSNLLPPDTTTKAVATQGLIHLLTLATNSILKIDQSSELLLHIDGDEERVEFDEIFISIEL
jgi:hypothetical protein